MEKVTIVEEREVQGGKYVLVQQSVRESYLPPRTLLSFTLFSTGGKYV